MLSSDIPLKLPVPFGASAGSDFIRQIPVLSQIGVEDGAASLVDGFPPLNATPIGAGGVPPSVKDMNGILYEVSNWSRWVAAGGPVFYDVAFASAIGGYPAGAVLASATVAGAFWASVANNNTTNPDAGGSGWQRLSPVAASSGEVATGADGSKFVTPASLASLRASGAEAVAGTNNAKYISPAVLAVMRATIGEVLGGVEAAKYITPIILAQLRASAGEVLAGSNDAKYVTPASLTASISRSFGTSGFYVLPGGLILQWGPTSTVSGEAAGSVTFPMPFPTACVFVSGTITNASSSRENDFFLQLVSKNTSGATLYFNSSDNDGSAHTGTYFAVGF